MTLSDRSFRVLAVLVTPGPGQIRMFASESFTVALTVTLTAASREVTSPAAGGAC